MKYLSKKEKEIMISLGKDLHGAKQPPCDHPAGHGTNGQQKGFQKALSNAVIRLHHFDNYCY